MYRCFVNSLNHLLSPLYLETALIGKWLWIPVKYWSSSSSFTMNKLNPKPCVHVLFMLLMVKTIFIAVHGLEEFLNFSNFWKLSLGDARAYYLSTAKNELGVVSATSDAGVAMVPINWQEMQCPVTLQKEFRKVAKVCWLFPIHPKSSDTSWLFKLNHWALGTIAGASWSMILIFWPLQEHCWFLEEAASDTWSFSDVRVMKSWILSDWYSKVGVTAAHGLWAHLETKYKMPV